MIPYRLDTLQLTQEKEKSSVPQCSTGWFKKNFWECLMIVEISQDEWMFHSLMSKRMTVTENPKPKVTCALVDINIECVNFFIYCKASSDKNALGGFVFWVTPYFTYLVWTFITEFLSLSALWQNNSWMDQENTLLRGCSIKCFWNWRGKSL